MHCTSILLAGGCVGMVTNPPESLLSDMAAIRPTVFTAVPRVLTRIRGEYYKKFPKSPTMHKRLKNLIETKNAEQAKGIYDHKSFTDKLFFKKFRKALGGRVSVVVSASAALDPEVKQFFRAALSCPVTEMYGMTELTGGSTAIPLGDASTRGGGAVLSYLQIKLKDVPEMDLFAARDNRGEICFRGPCCTKGYYKDSENTKNLFDEEGWLRTGDIGQFNANGGLNIIDRCKSMFKLAQGEYIAPEKVEGIYLLCSLVRVVLTDGCSKYPFSVVIVSPDFTELRRSLAEKKTKQPTTGSLPNLSTSLGSLSDDELCRNTYVRQFVLEQMNKTGRQNGLKGFELAKNILLTNEEFSPSNGLLTPTLKLARFKVRAHFQDAIQNLYGEGDLLPSARGGV